MNSFEKVVSYFLGIVAMFSLIFLFFTNQQEKLQRAVVKHVVSTFAGNVCTDGFITIDMWDQFITKLEQTGASYTIDLECTHQKVNPKEDNNFKTIPNTYIQYDEVLYTEEFLETLASEEIVYFTKGDYLKISVKSISQSLAAQVRSLFFFYTDSDSDYITAEVGGYVRDEAY